MSKRPRRRWLLIVLVTVATVVVAAAVVVPLTQQQSQALPVVRNASRVAFIGNSIMYYNDLPRLIEAMYGGDFVNDCCFKPGGSLPSMLADGNDAASRLSTDNARREDGSFDVGPPTVAALLATPWDFVVFNDYTQAPARYVTRAEGVAALVDGFAPLLAPNRAQPILLMTYAYRLPGIRGSNDLGNATTFTRLLREGYDHYATALGAVLPAEQRPLVAPFGTAVAVIRDERPALHAKLYDADDTHPSPSGSYLAAAVLLCTMHGTPTDAQRAWALPNDPSVLWRRARYMQRPGNPVQPFPSREEAAYLLDVAARVVSESVGAR